MALSKKPSQKQIAVPEDVVTALINKGGSVPAQGVAKQTPEKLQKKVLKGGQVPVQLRLSPEIVDVIDALIAQRLIPVSRHAWFMNAIVEQIKREQEG
jgi:hypothetical protein